MPKKHEARQRPPAPRSWPRIVMWRASTAEETNKHTSPRIGYGYRMVVATEPRKGVVTILAPSTLAWDRVPVAEFDRFAEDVQASPLKLADTIERNRAQRVRMGLRSNGRLIERMVNALRAVEGQLSLMI